MTELFRTILNMSITGAYIAAVIIILRILMKKLPKKYSYLLWAILGIRLLCPFSFSSAVSIFNILIPENSEISSGQMEYISRDIAYSFESQITMSVPQGNGTVNNDLSNAESNNIVNTTQIVIGICMVVWLVGMMVMLIYTIISYISVKKRVRNSFAVDNGIFICYNIETPFVFGIIKPRIYLSENVANDDMRYIIAHEQAHIRRGDHIVNLIAMVILCIHWFNPMVWVSYRLMKKDMELSCDEMALGTFETDVKKAYANALLNISLNQNKFVFGDVLNFGESAIKSRIKGVLGSKKPKVFVTIFSVTVVVIAAVCLLTNSVKKKTEFEVITNGVYVTDKLLYNAPYKNSYWGDNNGLTYEIRDNYLIINNVRENDIKEASRFIISEPVEIPFTNEEWNETFDSYGKTGWQDGEKNLSDYENKYCFALQSDKSGNVENYLFIMDGEIWYVKYGLEIYRLKIMDTSPIDAARRYLSGKNITDENISELTVSQFSFYNEAWKYTIPEFSDKYGVKSGDNVIEVIAIYSIGSKEVQTCIITSANETGFRVLDEVNYLLREFTAVITEVHGNEQVTGYEWQEYVIIPNEDSYGFKRGEEVIVYSKPNYGNDFFNVGDKVKVEYSGEPMDNSWLEHPAYFLHLSNINEKS